MKACALLLACSLLFFACKKGDDETPVGGPGGNATLKITPWHHDKMIDSCMIYIKYNAVNPPADSVYDDSARCVLVNGEPIATFAGLKKGNYYLFGYGWDPQLSPPQAVRGGIAWPVTEETLQYVKVPVSEGD
jgi:hypothetical protein